MTTSVALAAYVLIMLHGVQPRVTVTLPMATLPACEAAGKRLLAELDRFMTPRRFICIPTGAQP